MYAYPPRPLFCDCCPFAVAPPRLLLDGLFHGVTPVELPYSRLLTLKALAALPRRTTRGGATSAQVKTEKGTTR